MEDLKVIVAGNLVHLRNASGMTQSELAGKLNYSDKSISKWERAEALPDTAVLKQMADLFGVSTDYLLTSHDQWQGQEDGKPAPVTVNFQMIIWVAMVGVLSLAILLFVVFWIYGYVFWLIPICGAIVALIVLLVLNSIWNGGRRNVLIVAALVAALFGTAYYLMRAVHPWQLIFALLPCEAIVFMSFRIVSRRKEERRKG